MTTLPTPSYADASATLYFARWEEIVPLLPAGSVDAVITDSPYGTTALEWDIPVDWPTFWPAVYRLCKPSAVQVMFSAQPFTTDLINSNRPNYRYELIWEKTRATGFLDANRRPLRCHENIQVFGQAPNGSTYNPQMTPYDKPSKVGRPSTAPSASHYGAAKSAIRIATERYPTSILPFANSYGGTSDHETAKNVQLMMWLVATYTNPGDLVLDPFVGSGSTAEACKRLGRRCIGIEMREQPLRVAARRLRQEVMEVAA
jgi:site-specific DNA-methyltransferase (adenine-specific)